MSKSADEILNSLKGNITKQLPQKQSQVKSHEVDSQTLTFMFGSEEHTFPFTQIRHISRNKERILIATYSANIEVKGKNLELLSAQLRRYKLSIISESIEEEEDQLFIDSISVTFTSEEDAHA